MLIFVLVLFIVVLVILGIGIYRQPDEFRVTRYVMIEASPGDIYPYLSDLRRGNEWSPWARLDAGMKHEYEGSYTGLGSIYKWDGDRSVGKGMLTITAVKPNELVKMRIEFLKPIQGTNTVEYALVPQGDHTLMSWTMYGRNRLVGKIMNLFVNCEKMCGDMFDRGLATLKTIVEFSGKTGRGENW